MRLVGVAFPKSKPIRDATLVRVSFRNYVEIGFRGEYIGFRCAAN